MRIVLLVCLAVAAFAVEERVTYEGYKVLRLHLAPEHLKYANDINVQTWNLDWWRRPAMNSTEVTTADIMVAPEGINRFVDYLTRHNIEYEVMISDVEALAQAQLVSPPPTGAPEDWFKAYHDYNSTVDWTKALAANYSSIASLISIGTSYQGRTMYAVRVTGKGGPVDGPKPSIFYDGGIHAREWIAPAAVQYVLWSLVSNYGKDPAVTKLVDNIEWTICPIFNVDGYQFTHTNNRMWRKTRMPNAGSSCIGTDPCRNSDNHWGGKGSSGDPCSDTYRGKKAFDQPEVKAIADYGKSRPLLKGYINFHSYSQLWMTPWSYDYVIPPQPDYGLQRDLNKQAVAAIKASSGLTYREGPGASTIYPASGDIGDYLYAETKCTYSTCVELRDTGRYGFLLPPDQIIPTGKEIWAAVQVMGNFIIAHP